MRRAGTRKTGSMITARTVTSHEVLSMTMRVRISATRFVTTPDSVPLKACCAPITSLLSRLTRAPVRVRVKNAIGILCTWSNTAVRRSRITPSPMRAENQRVASDTAASATATSAMTTASRMIVAVSPRATMTSTTWPASTGVATARNAPTTDSPMKTSSFARYGTANVMIRFTDSREMPRDPSCALEIL